MPWRTLVGTVLFVMVLAYLAAQTRTEVPTRPTAPPPYNVQPTQHRTEPLVPPPPPSPRDRWPLPLITPGKDYLPWGS